jgi:hypothetical protein
MKLSHSYSAIKLYENCPLRYYRQRVIKDVVDEGGEASIYGSRVHELLEKRLAENAELPKEVSRYEPLCKSVESLCEKGGELHVEKELVLTEELKVTGWWEPDAWLRSKLDILVLLGDNAIVMDWKTGKRRADSFQMEMFAAQVFKHYPEVTKVKTSLVWLKSMALDTDTYQREQSNDLWVGIMSRIRRIHDSLEHDNWPARPSGLCRFCPARHDCDYALL